MKLEFVKNYPISWQKQIQEYLIGERKKFSVKPVLDGTSFQKAVWREIMTIPYGEVKSYSELAKAIGRPKAYRAVANACGKNPYPIIIPCHRVVAVDGLGGFSLSLDIKRFLLELEKMPLDGHKLSRY
jgi:methylated-DNA-[protein]-cysteine S-methyltransferase